MNILQSRSTPAGRRSPSATATAPSPSLHPGGAAATAEPSPAPAAAPGRVKVVDSTDGLFICLVSAHGLIRGDDPELGRDADTGGQVLYVLELARALSRRPEVARVELMTRQILSTNVAPDYAELIEQIAERGWIVRVPFGPHRYLRKESLWPYLPQFVDNALLHFRKLGAVPDIVHGHYPDAGVVGMRLGKLLGSPTIYTGHSLGRVKRQRLLEKGLSPESIESRYNITRRINAEERVFEGADLVIASTSQEVAEQYGMYDVNATNRMVVNAPGVNLDRFRPPRRGEEVQFAGEIDRFLREPKKPMILAVQRPDERKNLETLIRTYGEHEELRERANLVLLIGARDDLDDLPRAQRMIVQQMLHLIDRFDLYGRVAYPKNHTAGDVAEVYRLATRRHGVFINPAIAEPFGLTLIEAAASGLPIVATHDGGPTEIIEKCKNGVLVDPMDASSIADGLLDILRDPTEWRRRSRAGVRGADTHFSWSGHAKRYLRDAKRIRCRRPQTPAAPPARMVLTDRLLVCDIDNTLLGDLKAAEEFASWLDDNRERVAFGVATGRDPKSALGVLSRWSIPTPDALITSVGSEIHYWRGRPVEDLGWRRHIDRDWDPDGIREALEDVPGLKLQPKRNQRPFKVSYFTEPNRWPGPAEVRRRFRDRGLRTTVVASHSKFLDLLPGNASKGQAVKHLTHRWGFHRDHVLVAGDSGIDALMLKTAEQAVVVGNFSRELRGLRGRWGIHFATAKHGRGILEGIRHFGFLGADRNHQSTHDMTKGDHQ